MKWSSRRMKQVTEAVQGIAVIKFFAWESAFAMRIGKTRAMELKVRMAAVSGKGGRSHRCCYQFVKKFSVSIAGLMTVGWVSSSVLAVAAFLAYSMVCGPSCVVIVAPWTRAEPCTWSAARVTVDRLRCLPRCVPVRFHRVADAELA